MIHLYIYSCGFKPEKVEFDFASCNKNGVLSSILDKYRNHPSILKSIKTEIHNPVPFLYLLPAGALK